jgi:hypothetical protein
MSIIRTPFREDAPMPAITDESMRQMLATTRNYCIAVLKAGPGIAQPGVDKIIWEHGRRMFALRAAGSLVLIFPCSDDGDIEGLGIFTTGVEETRKIMEADPAVVAGVFVCEYHACRSFPGDGLPK